jgi:hypothetical protein
LCFILTRPVMSLSYRVMEKAEEVLETAFQNH